VIELNLFLHPIKLDFRNDFFESLYWFLGGGQFISNDNRCHVFFCLNHPFYKWEGILVHEVGHYNAYLKEYKAKKEFQSARGFSKIKPFFTWLWEFGTSEGKAVAFEDRYEAEYVFDICKINRLASFLFMCIAILPLSFLVLIRVIKGVESK